jgi:parallel beta-helix repeat protein/predicted outer membrane repeat protein
MKYLTQFLFSLLFVNFANIQATNVSGNVYGHWTLANSPYNVVNNIVVPSDSTLLIDPGVDVTFNASYELKVDGRIMAIGSETDSITFTAPTISPGFAGIRFEVTNASQDSSIFEYCFVKNANRGNQFLTGMDNYGGAFLFNNFNKVRIQHCSITYCKAFDGGGGICIYNSSNIAILDNYISYNNALDASSSVNDGGGIYCKGNSSPIISRNEISYNEAAGHGGAIYVSGGSPQINNNLITRNNIYPCWFTGNCNVNVYDNIFTYNNLTNGNIGAPISVNQAINVSIQNNIINRNVNSNYSGFLKGGGIYVGTATTILIKGNSITNNSISVSIGGYVLEGGGIYCNTTNKAFIIGNTICNNYGAANGGGVYIRNGFLINNVICNNMALGGTPSDGKGGGVCIQDTAELINNTIANNYAKRGGGVYINGRRNSKLFNCIVSGNNVISSGNGNQVYCNNTLSTLNYTILNCNIDSGQAGIGLLNNNLLGMTYQNNIDTLPGFVNPSTTIGPDADTIPSNWSLLGTSACINAGDSALITEASDILGNTRNFDTNVDMGAYEYQSVVLNLPNVNFILSNNTLCQNDSLQMQNVSTNATSFLWTFQDGFPSTSTSQNPSVTWNSSGNKTIKLVAYNTSGIDSLSQIISVNPLPTPSVISANTTTTLCTGDSVILIGNNSGIWNNGSTASDTLIFNEGAYFVTTTNSCGSTVSNTITVNQILVDTAVTVGNASFFANASNATYQWLLCNGTYSPIPSETNQTYTPTMVSGFYAVEVTQNGCVDTSACYPLILTGLSNSSKIETIELYPNPANNQLTVDIGQLKIEMLTIQNTLGDVVFYKQNCNALETIDVSGFASGIYIIRSNQTSIKFIKQ